MNGKRILSVSAALILGATLLSGTASAAPSAADARGNHCVVRTDSPSITCFATVAEVQEFLAQSRSAAARAAQPAAALAGSYTAAVVWDYYNSPASTWITSDYQCGYYAAANLPSGMNNRASYVDVYPGCYLSLWTNTGQSGSVEGFPAGGWNVTQINNQASSYEIWP